MIAVETYYQSPWLPVKETKLPSNTPQQVSQFVPASKEAEPDIEFEIRRP
jgi:hypothetical protein